MHKTSSDKLCGQTGKIPTLKDFIKSGDALYHSHLDIANPFNRLEQALNEYSKAMEQDPDNPALLAKVSKVFLRKGNYHRAQDTANRALVKNNRLPDAHYVLGYVRYKERNFTDSIRHLNQAIRHSGLASSRFRFCQFYSLSELSRQTKNPVMAFWLFTQAAYQFVMAALLSALDPEPVQFFQLFRILPGILKAYLKEQSSDKDGALAEYQKLHQKYLGFPPVMNLISSIYQRKGLEEEAMDWLNKAIARDPLNEEGYFQLAGILEQQNEHSQVLALYKKLLALRPGDAQIHCSLGNLYASLQETDEAIAHYKAAFNLSEDRPWQSLIAQTLGNIYQEIKRNPEAAQSAFQSAIELNPAEVSNYIHLGILYFESGDYINSQIVYEQALAINPDNPRIHSNLGYLKWLKNEIPEAVAHYERAIALDPYYDIPYNNLGVIHLDVIGNIPKAIELIEKAVEQNDHYALAYYNLGRAHMFLDHKLEAAKCFQKAQVLNEYTKELDNEELTTRLNNLFNTRED